MTVEIVNFGCRLNTYEGEVMREQAQKAGLQNAIIFNSCAVTAEAERQVRQAIRKARKQDPNVKIIVTGCSAQVHPDDYTSMAEVDRVLGNAEKMDHTHYQWEDYGTEKVRVNDIMSIKETASHLITSFEGRARAFVQVQNGCDHRCTFCIIPFGRGPSRSVPIGEIVNQVRVLVEQGFKEVVLTGVDISDYGKDLPGNPSLGQMTRRLLAQVPQLPRLRISSIDVAEIDEDLMRLIAEEPRLMPHMHLSLQAGDDMILKRMKRRHTRQQAIDFCAEVRRLRPDAVFGADIIAGFPTETDEMFDNTLRTVEEAGLIYLHVFPYSSRSGTPAARMPQVKKEVRKERAARLRAQGEKQLAEYLATQVGRTVPVLMEKENMGRTEHFAPVVIEQPQTAGSIVTISLTSAQPEQMMGRIAA